ncbi:endospore germination permease [Paenibacillus sp. SYP-B3998]|uniref:Endospore germination permease n=1 Tax=Paenibacillus sp. SYP-B3998 TaxID=2678564 RepID=A0A6G3ZZ07_9BACL|nr:endospore germination permease [Paenibacillus sp. SYP-B3998]NEW06637.1 endospore germination permease [Paenibacillus sp. SYP-B3998]
MGTERLTPRQFMILVILFSIGTAILIIPSALAAEAKQDAWILEIVGVGIGIVLCWLYIYISKLHPGCTIFQINEKIFGKWLGKCLSLGIAFTTLIFSSQVLFYVGNFLITQIMPTTPIEATHILVMVIVIMGAKLGVIVLARTGEIFFPWIILLFILFMVVIIPQVQFNFILPIGEVTVMPVIRGALKISSYSYMTTFFVFNVLFNKVASIQKATKGYIVGALVSGIMMFTFVVTSILVLGPENTAVQAYPSYALAQRINIGNVLQRIEVIIAFLWLVSIFFELSLYFYITLQGIAEVFQLKDYKNLCYPIGVIVTVLSFVVYPSTPYQSKWDEQTWIPQALLIGVIYPILIVSIDQLKKLKVYRA